MSTESHLPPFSVRPRFEVELAIPPQEVIDRMKKCLKEPGSTCRGTAIEGFVVLRIPDEDRHYWSPQLSLTVEESASGDGSLIRGLYGPSPGVWTMFVFFYAAIGIVLLFILLIGFSHYSLDQPAGILWAAPILIAVLLSLYLVSYFGQKLGHDQMEVLHEYLESCLGQNVIE